MSAQSTSSIAVITVTSYPRKTLLVYIFTFFCNLTLFVCSVPVDAQDHFPCILGILLLYLYQEKYEITKKLHPRVSGYFKKHRFFFSVQVFGRAHVNDVFGQLKQLYSFNFFLFFLFSIFLFAKRLHTFFS